MPYANPEQYAKYQAEYRKRNDPELLETAARYLRAHGAKRRTA